MKTKTIQQTVKFSASPRAVYELLMDSRKHTALSGEKARISRRVGGPFTAWDSHITGINLVLKPGRRIVQAWRATGWWPGSLLHRHLRHQEGPAGFHADVHPRSASPRPDTAATIEAGSRPTGPP